MSKEQCPNCRVPLPGDAGFIFCSQCRVPQFLGDLKSPFQIFDVPRTFDLDEKLLEARYYELSKKTHPDRFSAVGAEARLKSHELSAALNRSYNSLRQPESRLDTLLRSIGALAQAAPAQNSREQIPVELAEEFFEIQESVMEEPKQAHDHINRFERELNERMSESTKGMFEIAKAINWEQPDRNAVDRILELRRERSYLRSLLENLSSLRDKLAQIADE